eukprot:1512770-Rhodomonas_salina.1
MERFHRGLIAFSAVETFFRAPPKRTRNHSGKCRGCVGVEESVTWGRSQCRSAHPAPTTAACA